MPNWTKNQQEAIDLEGCNIIVSAGAGSGKTAVLTERVIRKLNSGVGIDKLLILTFTKAAANEMKTRIRKAIKKIPTLSSELRKIDSSYITTFDSYSLLLVKKYHYLLNIKKDVNIIDSNLLKIKTNEYLDIIMEEEYLNKKDDYVKLIEDFCVKDDKELRKIILNINDKLNMKYNKKEYLNNYINNYYSKEEISNNINSYLNLLLQLVKRIDQYLNLLSYEVDTIYLNKINSILLPVINSNTYDSIKENINIIKLPNIPKGSSEEAKSIKEKIKKSIDDIKELTRYENTDELIKSINLTKPYLESITRIILKLDEKLDNYKYENDLYDFVDISKLAIKLVKENYDIKEEIKNSFNEIMLDEYQDTSDLQEEFINNISNNNVYVVGDIKQSIYRFRNANPDIFRNKYNLYNEGINGKKIDLLDNFRSRKEVVNGINLIFKYIMSDLIGGADYINTHQMVFGNIAYEKDTIKQNNDLEVYTYPDDKESLFSKDEIEAFIIANDIKNKINNHFKVYDKKKDALRDVTYNDFCILMDRSVNFDLYKKIFFYKQIPLSIYQDEKLTNSELFLVIRNIFKIINLVYDKKFDKEMEYAYLSIGRSFLFNYSDQELFDVVVSNNYQETDILNKINNIINNIQNKSISMILDNIIDEFDVYENLRKIPDIESNYVKLEYMYTLADNLNKMGYTYKDFDEFLETILDSDTEVKFSMNKEESNAVKIMTIHHSKGLEYPICYYSGLSKKINDDEIKGRILYNNSLGIVTPYNDNGCDYTFYRELIKQGFYQEEISEKIRLLYVALTRAREKMIFIVPDNDLINEEYENDLVSSDVRMNYRSFLDILMSIKSKLVSYTKNIDIKNIGITKAYNYIDSDNLFNSILKTNEKIKIVNIPKLNVIKKSLSHFSKSSSKLLSREEKEKMEFGTKIHYYLETLDLKNPDLTDIKSPFKEKIISFLECDLIKNIKDAKIYQEYEFIDSDSFEDKHGIIDLMIEYDNYIDIIDYKLKNIMDEAYSKQLNGYKNYIEKISNKTVNVYLYSIIDSKYRKL